MGQLLLLLVLALMYSVVSFQNATAVVGTEWTNTPSDPNLIRNQVVGLRAILSRGNFACGFYAMGNDSSKFVFGVFMVNGSDPATWGSKAGLVWSPNRQNPVGEYAVLKFTTGNLVLEDEGTEVWSSKTNSSGNKLDSMEIKETGNLVLLQNAQPIWQSFSPPTDVLVEGQQMLQSQKLVSEQGNYTLEMNNEQLFLQLTSSSLHYWFANISVGSDSASKPYIFFMNGTILISTGGRQNSTVFSFPTPPRDPLLSFLKLDADGNLRMYEFVDSGFHATGFVLDEKQCQLPSTCGPYGLCSDGNCSCVSDELSLIDRHTPHLGCHLPDPLPCNNGKDLRFVYNKATIYNLGVRPLPDVSESSCQQACALDCGCLSAIYDSDGGTCYTLPQVHGFTTNNVSETTKAFIKLRKVKSTGNSAVLLVSVLLPVSGLALTTVGILLYLYKRKLRRHMESDEELPQVMPGELRRFTYRQLYDATDGFIKKLGQGGFGSVFHGILKDGSQVAVKRLDSLSQGQKEFKTEVSVIGGIHHFNLVKLVGFCAEKHHRLLVYEYMTNGSLDRWLFVKEKALDFDTRFSIALGIARGLRYLHEDCKERIIHLDVKPQNVLLDDEFNAKVGDFGMSKLVNRNDNQEVFTTMRGTRGYLAPEWLQASITEKVDVYSFGIVLLEIVSGQRCLGGGMRGESSSQGYFPSWASQRVVIGRIMDIVDMQLHEELRKGFVAVWEQVEMMIYVALWCIQEDPAHRPSMATVVQMLEGIISVSKPPLSLE